MKILFSKNLLSIVIPIVLIIFFTFLLNQQLTSDTVFLALVSLSLLIGCIIYFHDAIESLNLRELKITLREVKEVKYSIETIAESIVDVVGTLSVYSSGSSIARKKLNTKLADLLDLINSSKKNEIMRDPILIQKFMGAEGKKQEELRREIEKRKIKF
ncbi:MAG: hypothetical protein HY426_02345 [Candidatus Levybacteria bacterium]|nr:hypothetical protein [Candidatus Levybacteria bacterium]